MQRNASITTLPFTDCMGSTTTAGQGSTGQDKKQASSKHVLRAERWRERHAAALQVASASAAAMCQAAAPTAQSTAAGLLRNERRVQPQLF